MSIIQEALKKAEKTPEITYGIGKNNLLYKKEGVVKVVGSRPNVRSNSRILIYALAFLVVLSILAVKYFSTIPHKTAAGMVPVPAPSEAIEPVQPVAQPPVAPQPVTISPLAIRSVVVQPAAAPQAEFTLSGIMHLEVGPRAIINNLMVAEGDRVEDATIITITDDSVLLQKRDSEITLHLK